MDTHLHNPIIFFDGVCNLCNNAVQFIIRHDKQKIFLFASLQSPIGKRTRTVLNEANMDTIVLFNKGKYYTKSDAVLQVLLLLGGVWKMAVLLKIFPRSLRNWAYDYVASNRYKWFGKQESCMLPAEDWSARFLSE